MRTTKEILLSAKKVYSELIGVCEEEKNFLLETMADYILKNADKILAANRKDMAAARGRIPDVMLDRLELDAKRISAMASGIREVAKLKSNVETVIAENSRPDGLYIRKVRIPLGVIAIIYESRPNVTADAAALCVKSGNVCVLRCGKDAFNSAYAIVEAMREALSVCGYPKDLINLVEDTTRQSANELMTAVGLVDLLIPRGGKGLIKACTENAKVPCIETGTGICHIYVDKYANLEMAVNIVENAKASRPSVCNAAEVCLVHRDIAKEFLPKLYSRFTSEYKYHKVKIKGDGEVCKIINAEPATDTDFDTEFLDYILAVKIVDDVKEAVSHIAAHSTHHSDCIITEDQQNADYFSLYTDSAAVYVNASTRFTDGGEFGLGCEMGISTQKLHARGPMGLEELTTYKYVVTGEGHIR